jgi:DNA excision repair protein ERCC-3
MPPKRKAPGAGAGPSKAGKASTTSTPGPATPASIGSSDEYSEEESQSVSGDERFTKESLDKARDKFSVDSYVKPKRSGPSDALSRYFGSRDFSYLTLKPDHQNRPLWLNPDDLTIILESFHPLAGPAQDFLITIAEPQSRPTFLHEYKITAHSLYAAVSVGLNPQDIINTLNRFCKAALSEHDQQYILQSTAAFGKLKLVLKDTKYYLESPDPEILRKMLNDEIVGALRVQDTGISTEGVPRRQGLVISGTVDAAGVRQAKGDQTTAKSQLETQTINESDVYAALNEDDDDDQEVVQAFQVKDEEVETLQKRCLELGYPLLEEYDFRRDDRNANLDIDLRPTTQIRPYQEKSLSKMFGNGRAKSGIIVLPCGAGKTLVGITAACTIKKGVIVLCTSAMSVVQWRLEFLKWSNIKEEDVAIFTADSKAAFTGNTGVIVTTYSMVTQTRERAHDSKKMMDFLTGREWGLMLLDEVHVVPAEVFRKVTSRIKTHSKLGLTATLLREDDKISHLNFLIGPKLYEANWMELSEQGHIARVQCAEVWCPMTTEFYEEYLRAKGRKRQILYVMNPRKFQACQYLVNYHEARGDKIIVFSDDVYALQKYAIHLGKAMIHGQTAQSERMTILENFQHNPQVNTLFLSKIGDTSLDLPEATCLIQVSSHYGSRRQEAQRLGRILRAKRRNDEGFNAFFYSLVSKDTQEMYYSSKRQAFLVDQGYAFKVITQLQDIEKTPNLAFSTAAERRELLQEVLVAHEKAEDEVVDDLWHQAPAARSRKRKGAVRRTAGTLGELSGGQDMAYVEQRKSVNKSLKKKKAESHSFFKKLQREEQRRKQQG